MAVFGRYARAVSASDGWMDGTRYGLGPSNAERRPSTQANSKTCVMIAEKFFFFFIFFCCGAALLYSRSAVDIANLCHAFGALGPCDQCGSAFSRH